MLKRLLLVSLIAATAACTHDRARREQIRQEEERAADRAAAERSAESRASAGGRRMGTATELDFLKEASLGGQTEVALGRLARDRASSSDVKQFGQRMIDDHTRANAQLMTLARATGVTPPASLDAEHQQMVERLSGMSGQDFDKAYMKMMVEDHVKDVSQFERQAANAGNAEIGRFAQQTLPTLRQHLEQARDIAKRIGAAD